MRERRDLLTTAFFAAPAIDVARALIGCSLRRGSVAGIIVETEAYSDDEASHFLTRRPSAGRLMGETHGLAYVYSIYGMHLCLNVTADARGAGAVLLRALQPTEGLAVMRRRRGVERDLDLCRGPGRLAEALGVTASMSGRPFLELFELAAPETPPDVAATPRIGISRATELPWRLVLAGSRWVSGPRPAGRQPSGYSRSTTCVAPSRPRMLE